MKKVVSVLVVLGLLFMATPAKAADNNMMTKLVRGVSNVLDAVVEIPGTMLRTGQAEGAGAAITKGVVEGVVNTIKRGVVGAYEAVTFPIPIPADYEPILDEPKFLATE